MENQTELAEEVKEEVSIVTEDEIDEDTYVAEDDGQEYKIEASNDSLARRKKHSRGLMDVSKKVTPSASKAHLTDS